MNDRLKSILNPNASSADVKDDKDCDEKAGQKSSADRKVTPTGSHVTSTKEKGGKTKAGIHKGKHHSNDNFSNINDVAKAKHEESAELSSSPDITHVDSAANHCDSVSLLRKDCDNKKSNNYRMSKYSNASMDSVGTESSVISASELHMTVLSKHEENGSIKGSPGNLSPVAEV